MQPEALTELERAVLTRLLREPEAKEAKRELDLEGVKVTERYHSGAGFFTDFERCPALRLFDPGTSIRWGNVTADLNASKIGTGYLGYVDDGYLTGLEGYTHLGDWPDRVESFRLDSDV